MISPSIPRAAQIAAALAAPPIPVDEVANLERVEGLDQGREVGPGVAQIVYERAGIILQAPHAHRMWRNVGRTRTALLAVHKFGPPFEPTAEIVFLTERLPISRHLIEGAANWLAWDLGLVADVTVRIPAAYRAGQDIAHRIGFRFVGAGQLDNHMPASVWAWRPSDFYDSRFARRRPVPAAAAAEAALAAIFTSGEAA